MDEEYYPSSSLLLNPLGDPAKELDYLHLTAARGLHCIDTVKTIEGPALI